MKVVITRTKRTEVQTTGFGIVYNSANEIIFSFITLELPFLDNEKRISCIPAGDYIMKKHNSPKFGECLSIPNVPNRENILVHAGNSFKHTLGCVLVGRELQHIDKDEYIDLTTSKATLLALLDLLPVEVDLQIK